MRTTGDLTETQWQVADAIAQALVKEETDANELRKVIVYLRTYCKQDQSGFRFFTYLKTLVKNGNRIGRSKQTKTYYASIEEVCKQYLQSYQDNVATMLQILGWAARLMCYYKVEPPTRKISTKASSASSSTGQTSLTAAFARPKSLKSKQRPNI